VLTSLLCSQAVLLLLLLLLLGVQKLRAGH
jgi:hypothetical protein